MQLNSACLCQEVPNTPRLTWGKLNVDNDFSIITYLEDIFKCTYERGHLFSLKNWSTKTVEKVLSILKWSSKYPITGD